jgi:hypothetical protein
MLFPIMAPKTRSISTKEPIVSPLISQAAFAREHGWSPQYVGKLVQLGKLTLTNGKVDTTAANQELKANGVGMLRVNGAGKQQDSASTNREDRIQYAIDILLSTTALAKLHLDVEDPDKAEEVLRTVLADAPAILAGTFRD